MTTHRAQEYLRTKVMTASPAELRLLLLDGAIRFAEQAREGLEQKKPEQAYDGSRQCRAILTELTSGLRTEIAPELCDRLSSLYLFLYKSLVEAMSQRDAEGVRKIVEVLTYERETWRLAMEKLVEENSTSNVSQVKEAAGPTTSGGEPIGGRIHLAG
jgi:flagellar protein FliS